MLKFNPFGRQCKDIHAVIFSIFYMFEIFHNKKNEQNIIIKMFSYHFLWSQRVGFKYFTSVDRGERTDYWRCGFHKETTFQLTDNF